MLQIHHQLLSQCLTKASQFLNKESVRNCGWRKNWKQRWFVLKGSTFYYTKPDCKVLKGQINLDPDNEIAIYPECKKPHAFRLNTLNRQYEILSSSDEEANSWVSTISQVIKSLHNSSQDQTSVLISVFAQLRVLGRGAYYKLSLCKFKDSNKLHALKKIPKQFFQNNDLIERTKRIRDTLMTIKHPFLVGANYAFQYNTHVFMVLEYVQGQQLCSF